MWKHYSKWRLANSTMSGLTTKTLTVTSITDRLYIYGKNLIFQLSVLVEERKRKEPATAIIIYSFVL